MEFYPIKVKVPCVDLFLRLLSLRAFKLSFFSFTTFYCPQKGGFRAVMESF